MIQSLTILSCSPPKRRGAWKFLASRLLIVSIAALLAFPAPAAAQQDVTAKPYSFTVPFSGLSGSGTLAIPSRGQVIHQITYSVSSVVNCTVDIVLQGSNDGTHFANISNEDTDIGTLVSFAPLLPGMLAIGYYAALQLSYTTTGTCTFSGQYVGTSVFGPFPTGPLQGATPYHQLIFYGAASACNNCIRLLNPPFANTAGWIFYKQSAADTGGTIVVSGGGDTGSLSTVQTITLNTSAGGNYIQAIPASPANTIQVTMSGGNSGDAVEIWYFFAPATSSAVPSGGGGTVTPFACGQQASISLSSSGETVVLNGTSGKTIHVCHIDFAMASPVNITFNSGNSTSSCSSPTALTGTYQNVLDFAADYTPQAPLVVPAGTAFCIQLSAGITGGGVILYATF
jgi:hypothetical protein